MTEFIRLKVPGIFRVKQKQVSLSYKRRAMRRYITTLFLFFLTMQLMAQSTTVVKKEDSLYREDQFYIGINLNFLTNSPQNAKRGGISAGLRMGFLRDFPISKTRKTAIAIGLGVSYDQFRHNLLIQLSENNLPSSFGIIPEEVSLNKNRLSMATVEIPFELRLRTSSATNYDFFRFYTGVTIGYTFWHKAMYEGGGELISSTGIPEFEKLRLGATLSVGYDSFNAFIYYGLNPFFNTSAKTSNQETVTFQAFKAGLIFYFL